MSEIASADVTTIDEPLLQLRGQVRSVPAYFGASQHPQLGWLHHARADNLLNTAALICPALGSESLSGHRAVRCLADALADRGIACLRFDYQAAGDSADSLADAQSLAPLMNSITAARNFLQQQTGVDRIVTIGVRHGALLALLSAQELDTAALVLWGPVTSGRRCLREWKMINPQSLSAQAAAAAAELSTTGFKPTGFGLGEDLQQALSGLSVTRSPLHINSPACLIVEREELPPEDQLRQQLEAGGTQVTTCRPGGFLAGMLGDPHLTRLPAEAIGEIADWVEQQAGQTTASQPEPGQPDPQLAVGSDQVWPVDPSRSYTERILSIDAANAPFAIVCEPQDGIPASGKTLVFVNSGSMHHIGPNRLYVDMSRHLAALGHRVCRLDLAGIGDTPLHAGARDNDPYPDSAVADLQKVVNTLQNEGCKDITLAGICSGAWAAFHLALRAPLSGLILIDPDFYGERCVFGKPADFARPKDFVHYKRSAASWAKWRKLFRGDVNFRKILGAIRAQTRMRWQTAKVSARGEQHQLEQDLTQLAHQGVAVHCIFSSGDAGQDFLRTNGSAGQQSLEQLGLYSQVIIDPADHTFSIPSAQVGLADAIAEWLH